MARKQLSVGKQGWREGLVLTSRLWQYRLVLARIKLTPKKAKQVKLALLFLRIFISPFLIILLSPPLFGRAAEAPKYNVLLITIDTLRADRLSCYGSQRPLTPNIDKLAKRGTLFRLAIAHTPTTLPSHTNIMLGTTPPFHGVHDNLNFVVAPDFVTLSEYLKQFGYATAAFVGAYLLDHRFGLNQGFDTYDDRYSRPHAQKLANLERKAEEVIKPALEWLKKQPGPWFLWLHLYDPHDPYEPPEPFRSQYADDPYNGEVAYVDSALQPLIDLLETPFYQERTITVFTADHGEALGEHGEETHGFLAYNSTLWVPLIISGPGLKRRVVEESVSHIDLFPTLCSLLALPIPEHLQGISLLPALQGKGLPKRVIYFESLYPYYSRGWAPIYGLYQDNLKFIDSPQPELYDIKKDFKEQNNLIRSGLVEKYKKQLASLIAGLSGGGEKLAERRAERERIEKLRSLGYVSSLPTERRQTFGPEHDVKTLLPFNNQAVKAMTLYGQGEKEKAIAILEAVIKNCPQLDNAYSNLAIIYEKEKELTKAQETLRLGLTNIPSSYEFFFNYLSLLVNSGQWEQALKFFAERSAQFSRAVTDPEVLNLLGLAYAQSGELKRAIEIYETALSIDRQYAPALSNLATAHYSLFLQTKDRRDLQKALERFKQAIEVDPDFAHPYNGLGMIYRITGNINGAIFCWEKALELNPDWPQVHYHLGLARMEKGEWAKALSLFKTYEKRWGAILSPAEKDRLSSLIQACQDKLREK